MRHNKHNIEEQFSRWGKQQARLPKNNSAMRENIATIAQRAPEEKTGKKRTWFRFPMVITAGAGVMALLLFIHATNETTVVPTTRVQHAQKIDLDDTFGLDEGLPESMAYGEVEVGQSAPLGAKPTLVDSVDERLTNIGKVFHDNTINDTRQFLKKQYSATVQSRRPDKAGASIEHLIAAQNGRIDELSINKEYATIHFVIPKSSLSSFRLDMEGLFGEKAIEEYLSVTNRLSDKQNLEISYEENVEAEVALQEEKEAAMQAHEDVVQELTKNIAYYTNQIYAFQNTETTSTEQAEEVKAQLQHAINQRAYLQKKLDDARVQHEGALLALENRAKNIANTKENLEDQNQYLLSDVETVEGYVHVEKVNIFGFINLYVPFYWLLGISVALAIIHRIYKRGRSLPAI